MAVAAILLGYAGIVYAFGWWGVAGIALHVGVILLGMRRK